MTLRGWWPWATKGPLRGPCAFCLGETALDVEGVLKQALLRRGVPLKLVVDNGAAYRAHTLQRMGPVGGAVVDDQLDGRAPPQQRLLEHALDIERGLAETERAVGDEP